MLKRLRKCLLLLLAEMLLTSCQNAIPVNNFCLIATPIFDYEDLSKTNEDVYEQITQHNRAYACLCEDLTNEEIKLYKCKGN